MLEKLFLVVPSLLVLLFPQRGCHRLRLSGCCCEVCWWDGLSASDMFLCCRLSAPSEGGRYLTATSGSFYLNVAFVVCLVLVVLQNDISNSNLDMAFCIYI